jgi:peptide/nickel transport system permease protein
MLQYIIKRILYMIPTLVAISVVSFAVINLPPGDFVDRQVAQRRTAGENVTPQEERDLRQFYGLDKSIPEQYFTWISKIVTRGDFGRSFRWDLSVASLIWERLALTVILSTTSIVFVWLTAIPIGLYSAVYKYSFNDYFFTFLGFIGLATPNFLIALVLMYLSFRYLGQSVGGLFSPEYVNAPWSLAKALDLLNHLWVPVVVLGSSGTASLIRTLRANLLDELSRPYVTAARTKGVPERWLLVKYPLRHALNPFVSSLNDIFVDLVSGSTIVSVVLGLQTTGPLLLEALRSEDMFLAGSFIMLLSVLTVIGTLFSDILLAWLDPRIRFR